MSQDMKQELSYNYVLIRYGELALKGKNRKLFENQLQENIVNQLKDLNVKLKKTHGRLYLYLHDESFETVHARLKHIFGISSYSPAIKTSLELKDIQETALKAIRAHSPFPKTFKVSVKRANKRFPYTSQEMNHKLGAHILIHTDNLKVDVHKPEVELLVEIREDAAYIMSQKFRGAGGLPVGTSGKVMLMMSGGIDSPVAGYLCLKRGLRFEGVHFHSFPFTSERAKQKVVDLAMQLSQYAGPVKLHIVPFTEIQTEIKKHIPDEYSITIMRRLMMRITEALAKKHKALGIATGESVGQVASQTLESMHTINEVTNYPVLRPLVTMDKVEIIDIAQTIGTYDISILPYEDCCTVFQPKNPKTKPDRLTAGQLEERLNVEPLIERAVENTETLRLTREEQKKDTIDHLF
ncbi:thiamine biosynthesis protein ThiI [Caldalkalibacillus uzonensis]|uniref:Probable tRNA sulfurtransferase n=1 Tax=Caldalkalibacillus uzonensis TaxID=353224 RepID=A0ABU0CTM2_9BACI|nr:tRNA uracil 4-sulfurtransferase ThiI [Caldalkalibacillus uzonensis]MDQ0339775.1 thiamine biosynthesis protein ThiI [Caldalkalibacillus uzonensis]